MSLASAAIVDLLTLIRRELLRQRMVRAVGAAAWVSVGLATLTVGIHLGYRAVDPVYPPLLAGAALVVAIARALIMRPSLQQAATFADRSLEGRCAYRTLLEIDAPGAARLDGNGAAAVSALLEWIEAHAAQARAHLGSIRSTSVPAAALSSAVVAAALAVVILRLPGIAGALATASFIAPEASDSVAAAATVLRRDSRSDDGAASAEGADGETFARIERASRPPPDAQLSQDPKGQRTAQNADAAPIQGAAAANNATRNGFGAGVARDSSLATQLAQTVQFASVHESSLSSPLSPAGSGRSRALEATSGSGFAGQHAESTAAAVPPSQALGPLSSGPAERMLVSRYFSERARHP